MITRDTFIALSLALGCLAVTGPSCQKGAAPAAATAEKPMGEYVPGYKRMAGAFERKADFSRTPQTGLGKPDITLELKAAIAGYDPKELRCKEGQVVELVLIGVDDGQLPALTGVKRFTGHGFTMRDYDIWTNGLRAGVEKRIKFKATRAGTFVYECSVFCGVDHYKMNGKFIVEPAQ
jgi:hypothetical protein